MPDFDIAPADIEVCLANRRKGLYFPPKIEAAFEQHVARYRAGILRGTTIPTIIIYNMFLLADVLLLPRTLRLALLLHLGVVTPLILCAGIAAKLNASRFLRETIAGSVPVMMVLQIMTIFALNHGVQANQYQYLATMIVVNMNTSRRLDFRFAAVTCALIGVVYLAFLLPGSSPMAVKLIGTASMGTAIFVTLTANRQMERHARYAFLRRLQDQFQREKAEVEASRDALTGLYNRRHLERRADKIWSGVEERLAPAAVLMIDVDLFKALNDRYGHLAGDLCLKRIAGAVTSELRNEADLAVRYGGEEFLVLLPRTDHTEAVRIAERIRRTIEALAMPHEGLGANGLVTASVGTMSGQPSTHSLAELIAGADSALYAAKRNGRNTVWPPLVSKAKSVSPLQALRSTGETKYA